MTSHNKINFAIAMYYLDNNASMCQLKKAYIFKKASNGIYCLHSIEPPLSNKTQKNSIKNNFKCKLISFNIITK